MARQGRDFTIFRKVSATFVLLIVIIGLWVSFSQFAPPPAQRNVVPDGDFSIDRAMGYLKEVAKEPHPVGSEAHMKVRDYLVQQFQQLGIGVEVQQKEISQINVLYPQEDPKLSVYNILATIPGKSDSGNAVLITAHYDSEKGSPGTSDDGYGVAALLESARAIRNGPEPENTIYFLISDGEELGLVGASAFVENKAIMEQIKVVINMEARGNKGVPILFETNTNNLELIRTFQKEAQYPIAYSFAYEVYRLLPNDTDFTLYKNNGKQGYNFANIDGRDFYHSSKDTYEQASTGTLQHLGMQILPLLKKYAFMDAAQFKGIEDSDQNAVYFPLFQRNLIVYSEAYVMPMLAGLLLLALLTLVVAIKKQHIRFSKTLVAFLLILGSLIVIAGLIFLCIRGIALLMDLPVHNNIYIYKVPYAGWIMIALTLLSALLCFVGAKAMVKKFGAGNAAFGMLYHWLILAVLTSVFVKGMSYVFVLPAALSLLAILPLMFRSKGQIPAFYGYGFLIAMALPCVMLLSPIIYLIFVSMTVGIAPVTSVLASLAAFSVMFASMWVLQNNEGADIQKIVMGKKPIEL
ncbi:Zn-dependent amino-or carboxypeptidase, M28 family [Paenibacillaceae bacterium GAS479]|nr:Zn-dependent amino-or carboxypeptidase, M28 family [Paenibacillaceae bacterium GAS479]